MLTPQPQPITSQQPYGFGGATGGMGLGQTSPAGQHASAVQPLIQPPIGGQQPYNLQQARSRGGSILASPEGALGVGRPLAQGFSPSMSLGQPQRPGSSQHPVPGPGPGPGQHMRNFSTGTMVTKSTARQLHQQTQQQLQPSGQATCRLSGPLPCRLGALLSLARSPSKVHLLPRSRRRVYSCRLKPTVHQRNSGGYNPLLGNPTSRGGHARGPRHTRHWESTLPRCRSALPSLYFHQACVWDFAEWAV